MKITDNYPFVLLLVLISLTQCGVRNEMSVSDDFEERAGLGNVFYKLEKNDTVKVAYLGGSITAQPGWRVYSLEWFRENYPETEIEEINAAIGGTGSPFGVYRLQDQVLRYHPDLVFVEFAVNDAGTDPEKITESMEGIVRQLWQQDPETDICFVYTIKNDFMEIYDQDSLPQSVATMEAIADHYQIPSINFGPEVIRKVASGAVLFKGDEVAKDTITVFSRDGVHPYPDSGHKIYYDVFVEAFAWARKQAPAQINAHALRDPVHPSPLVQAAMISWKQVDSNNQMEAIDVAADPTLKGYYRYFNSLGKGEPGDEISFRFRGKAFGFFDVVGPGAGKVEITIDEDKTVYSRFDQFSSYWRISYKTIDGLEDTVHTVSCKVLDEKIDKLAILAKYNKDPGDYDYTDLNWYLAKIMINGELIE